MLNRSDFRVAGDNAFPMCSKMIWDTAVGGAKLVFFLNIRLSKIRVSLITVLIGTPRTDAEDGALHHKSFDRLTLILE